MTKKYELLKDDIDSFWNKVSKSHSCWIWIGAVSGSGYGNFKRHLAAHRVAYQLSSNESAQGKHIAHSCDNKLCVNPLHLVATTHKGNMRDMTLKGRHAKTKLSGCDISKIFSMNKGKSQKEIGVEFGVHQATISRVLLRKTIASNLGGIDS